MIAHAPLALCLEVGGGSTIFRIAKEIWPRWMTPEMSADDVETAAHAHG